MAIWMWLWMLDSNTLDAALNAAPSRRLARERVLDSGIDSFPLETPEGVITLESEDMAGASGASNTAGAR